MEIEKADRSTSCDSWPISQAWRTYKLLGLMLKTSSWLILFLSCFLIGCFNSNKSQDSTILAHDVHVLEVEALDVIARQCLQDSKLGTASTKGIAIIAKDNFKIGSISGTIYYDNDRNDKLSKLDGTILRVDDSIESLRSEANYNPGVFHSGPGLGPLRMLCIVETIENNDEKKTVEIEVDLSPIFMAQEK